jgi:hypothetical protein
MLRDTPFRKVTRPGLLDLKSYVISYGANIFIILMLLSDIIGRTFFFRILFTLKRGMCTSINLKNETIGLLSKRTFLVYEFDFNSPFLHFL